MSSGEEKIGDEDYGVTEEEQTELEKDMDLDVEGIVDKEDDDKDLIEISPYQAPDTIKVAKTKEHKLTTGEVVKPFAFTYKPMTDMQRTVFAENMRKARTLDKMRQVTYAALAKHVMTVEIDGFDPNNRIRWSFIHPPEVIEDISDAITGQVELPKEDLKNLLTGLSS